MGERKLTAYECYIAAGGQTPKYDRDRYLVLLMENGHLIRSAGDSGEVPMILPRGYNLRKRRR